MDIGRSLPPLIRGNARGVLDFFIDEIVIFRELFLIPDCDVIAQVQWWGEIVPALIRPPKIQLGDKLHKYNSVNTYYYHSINYEIKTTTELFKLYLSTCEVLEVAILEAVEAYVIGSAFLTDLLKLIKDNSNEVITTPIVNYEGEKIGEVKIHVKLSLANDVKSKKEINLKSKEIDCSDILNTYDSVDFSYLFFKEKTRSSLTSDDLYKQILNESVVLSSNSNKQYLPVVKPIIEDLDKENKFSVNFPYKIINEKEFDEYLKLQKMKNKQSFDKLKITNKYKVNLDPHCKLLETTYSKNFPELKSVVFSTDDTQNSEIKIPPKILNSTAFMPSTVDFKSCEPIKEKFVVKKHKEMSPCLPEVKISKDSSTVLHFKLPGKHLKSPSKKLNQTKSVVKKRKKIANKSSFLKKQDNTSKLKDKTDTKRSCTNEHSKKTTTKALTVKIPSLNLEGLDSGKDHSVAGYESLKHNSDEVVLDYLLGSKMSRNDKENALNQIKKMSPSHPLVSAISELTGTTCVSKADSIYKTKPLFVKVNNLNFNLKNPIEKSYYETFFVNTKSYHDDFEVAEFLNNPAKEKLAEQKSGFISETCGNINEPKEEDIHKVANENVLLPKNLKMRNACSKCNYYKKIDELNVVIDSLKHFEKKILSEKKGEPVNEYKQKFINANVGELAHR